MSNRRRAWKGILRIQRWWAGVGHASIALWNVLSMLRTSAEDCENAFEYDETSKSACKSTCFGDGTAGDTGNSVTFRYGHGLASGKPRKHIRGCMLAAS